MSKHTYDEKCSIRLHYGMPSKKNIAKTVYERSDWTCEICKQRGGKLQADHIKPFHKIISENKITSVQEAKMCVELWDVLNGRTLCIACHKQTETYGGIRKN